LTNSQHVAARFKGLTIKTTITKLHQYISATLGDNSQTTATPDSKGVKFIIINIELKHKAHISALVQ